MRVISLSLVVFELYNAVSVTAITIYSASAFHKMNEHDNPLSDASMYTLLVTGTGMMMWVLLVLRILTWRWTGWSQRRLKVMGTSAIGITTLWALCVIISQQIQINNGTDLLINDLVVCSEEYLEEAPLTTSHQPTNTIAASVLFLSCMLFHISIFSWCASLCSVLRELAPSFGMFYEELDLTVFAENP